MSASNKSIVSASTRAFSILELLVSMLILSVLVIVVSITVDQTGKIWRKTTGKIGAFQEARVAFESITRKLSQAMLNTYWDYDPPISLTSEPEQYVRESELHYLQGQSAGLLAGLTMNQAPIKTNSHAVFFQAPLGYSNFDPNKPALEGLLNASGFFVAHGTDKPWRPAFLKNASNPPERFRYRLMELWQPTEHLGIYQYSRSQLEADPTRRADWYRSPIASASSAARPLAENIIALVLTPQRSPGDPGPTLTSNYDYDTKLYLASPADPLALLSRNQMPPLVRVTMVALDEDSARRLEEEYGATAPLLQPGALFTNPAEYDKDMSELTDFLNSKRFNYRVMTTSVAIRQAKWSED
jgi:uncharacterized protein (TIGR02599 family)